MPFLKVVQPIRIWWYAAAAWGPGACPGAFFYPIFLPQKKFGVRPKTYPFCLYLPRPTGGTPAEPGFSARIKHGNVSGKPRACNARPYNTKVMFQNAGRCGRRPLQDQCHTTAYSVLLPWPCFCDAITKQGRPQGRPCQLIGCMDKGP